jgi:hypothetical protein
VPSTRHPGGEYELLAQSCLAWARSHGKADLELWLHHLLQRPILAIMEFIPGTGMEGIRPREYQTRVFSAPSRWVQLGGLLAFDMLRNNSDRLPCGSMWPSNGNVCNVFVAPTTGLVAIDNQTCTLDIQYSSRYLAKVDEFLSNICQHMPCSPSPADGPTVGPADAVHAYGVLFLQSMCIQRLVRFQKSSVSPWETHTTEDGKTFYVHTESGERSWEKPPELPGIRLLVLFSLTC